MNNSTATTNTPTTTENTTMITLDQMIAQRNDIDMYMMGLELGGACYTTWERQLSRLDHAIEIEIAQLQERQDMTDEYDGEWHPANLPDEVLMAQAEEAKMARDVQEYAERHHVTVRVVIKNNYMETMAGDTIQVRVSIPTDDFGADNLQLELRSILDSNLIWDAFSLSGMWLCSVDS